MYRLYDLCETCRQYYWELNAGMITLAESEELKAHLLSEHQLTNHEAETLLMDWTGYIKRGK